MRGEAVRVGFVGYGWIARAHAHALHTLNHLAPVERPIRLVSMAGRRPERVEATARALGFERWTTSWEELVDDPAVDVVANVAPNALHGPPSLAALELGKAVLCEKPLSDDVNEAERMLAAAESSGATHATGFNYRFVPAVGLARETIAAGRLGDIRHFRAQYLQDFMGSRTSGREPRPEGAVGDYSHMVDLLRHLVGEPLSVVAQTAGFVGETEDAFVAALDLPDGALAALEASRVATGWKGRQRIEVNGAEGSLWWDMEDMNRLHVFFVSDEEEGLGGFRDVLVTQPEHPHISTWWEPGHIIGWEASFVHQWRKFLEAVIEERPVSEGQASFEDGYRAAVLCDAILTSARAGRRIEVGVGEGARC
jgi:predicted dehydrogenase